MRFGLPACICCLVLLHPATQARPADLTADPEGGAALLKEGDDLADDGKPTEAVLSYQRAFERLLPGLRGLPFKHEVLQQVSTKDELRQFMLEELEGQMTPEEFAGNELAMKALGLIPRELDLKATMVQLYTEEVAAFYDPKTQTMHLIKEVSEGSKPTLLERLFGKKSGFDKDENKTVIAHELTHALADQHFGLDALQDVASGDDDRMLALSALIEGEATLAMIGASMEDWQGSRTAEIPAARLERMLSLMGPLMMSMAGGSTLGKAPPILSESMIFPYLRGLVFCARVTNAGGWDALNAAYGRPPLSTEQVLHPEKYGDEPDAPMAVDLGELEPGDGWAEAVRNVVGEMQLGVMLRDHGGRAAAAGWDGDAFAVFRGPDDRLGLVWRTTWDSADDAREFARGYSRYQTSKLGPEVPEPHAFPDSLRRPHRGATFAVERRAADVVIVEGFPSEATERLLRAAFRAPLSEKTQAPEVEAEAKAGTD